MLKDSIVREIFMNNVDLGERIGFNEDYKKLSDKAFKLFNKLIGALNDEQKKAFDNFLNAEMDSNAEGEFLHFKEGVKVGLRLAMECLL